MEKDLERYYNDFKRPSFAPTYHPTEEEFADPISYVAKIRPEAQQFGLIKIIPPPSFRPPFCIEPTKFEFVPRVQRLNEIDALFRLRIIYINKLVHFWKYSKDQQFRIPYIDNKYIDLYRLRQMVEEEGGLKRVNDTRRWAHIAKCLGFRGNAGQTMRQCYTRWIHPFELSVANKEQQKQEPRQTNVGTSPKKGGAPGAVVGTPIRRRRSKQKQPPATPTQHQNDVPFLPTIQLNEEEIDASCALPSSSSFSSSISMTTRAKWSDATDPSQPTTSIDSQQTLVGPQSMELNRDHNDHGEQNGQEQEGKAEEVEEPPVAPPLTRSQARMMAGSAKTAVPSLDKSSIQAGHRTTPIELVMCGRCGGGDDEARLLLCETCDASMHTYCATPPLAVVPKGEWRCAQCVANAVRSVSMDFGFTDSNQCFTLDTFGEWANLYKQQYFNQEPREVPPERVESEFWRNVIDIDKGVQVKYGADLISSKVGSGFPRREDSVRGVADARERQQYANHPWNLNNLPKVRESVLCHMNTDISGMIIPWVYIGMLFSTFCWHVEDHWLYSINYNHWGERKIWYGVPGDEAELFDQVVKESAPELFVENKDLLHQMITHINPQFLIDRGIHVYTVHQNAGEFVITFPRSYHAGFNEGLNCAEAVNFAPPDWLKMGRLCLENYANVGRTCVFSHEELVMKMVTVAHKMSIAMCLATLDELSWIVARETDFRHRLSLAGVHATAFCPFEDIPDDERSCVVCRTTLFCSGLCCRHDGRMVCAQHVHQLCTECSLDQCCLKFRYTLDDLEPLVHRLTERTTAFLEWRKAVAELYGDNDTLPIPGTTTDNSSRRRTDDDGTTHWHKNEDNGNADKLVVVKMETNEEISGTKNGHNQTSTTTDGQNSGQQKRRRIDVFQLRALADQWRTARFPHCEEIQRISQAVVQFDRTANAVRKVLNRKIRLRDQTRCQKADTRWEYAEVNNLRQQLADSLLEDRELEDGIQDLCHRVERWKSRANTALERPFAGAQTVNELCALVTEAAEEFNVKLEAEGLNRLKSELARCDWLVTAHKIVRQIERHKTVKGTGKEGEEEEEQQRQNSVDELHQNQQRYVEEKEEGGQSDERDAKRGGLNGGAKNIAKEHTAATTAAAAKEGQTDGTAATTSAEEEDEQQHQQQENEQKQRVELRVLAKTVADGLKWCPCCEAVSQVNAKLEHFLNYGNAIEQRAADFLAFARKQQNQQQQNQSATTTTTTTTIGPLSSTVGDSICDGGGGGGCVADTASISAMMTPSTTATTTAAVGVEWAQQRWAALAALTKGEDGDGGGNTGESGGTASSFGIEWIQSLAIDTFRAELQLAQKVYDEFELLNKKAFSLRNLEQLDHNFAQSLFERDGQRHAKLRIWLDSLQRFVERIRTIFQKTASYYTLFDIVAGRSDLPALIEGESMPLALFTSAKYSDNWRPLRTTFVSRDQLVAHLQSVGDQQCTLLHALRLSNAGRSPKETCCCARDSPPPALSPGGRRQRLLLNRRRTPPAASNRATTNSRQRKRASLPSRTASGGGGCSGTALDDASPPTMVVSGRRTLPPTTPSSTSETSAEEQHHQQQQPMDTDEHQQTVVGEQRIAANELIPCFVCNANLHVVCAQWDPFFDRLPPGVLLCQRCLRSRRPCITDVELACRSSALPETCLERIVVQNLFNRSVNIFTRLQRLLHTIPRGTKQIESNVQTALKKWLTMALSLEVTDVDVYNVLANSAYFELFPLPARQIQIWHHIRERMTDDAQPLPLIFGHSIGTGGPSASSSFGGTNCGGGGGRRTANAGAKRRNSTNNNNSQQLRHSLSAMLNISSSSACSSADGDSPSLLLFSVMPSPPPPSPSSSSVLSSSGLSPAKQQRRCWHQQTPKTTATTSVNRADDDDGLKMEANNGIIGAGNATTVYGGGDKCGGTLEKREEEEQMEHEEQGEGEANTSSADQQQTNDDDDDADAGAHMDKCAADFCLRPYSEFTRWIQCEAGCARWYHFCCVGISVRGAQQISAYCCYKCAAAAAATAGTSVAAEATAAAEVATVVAADEHRSPTTAATATV